MKLEYYCDRRRHLVCKPYSIENLHKMAENLKIGQHFFEISKVGRLPHYDIPANRIHEIMSQCEIITKYEIVKIIRDGLKNDQ